MFGLFCCHWQPAEHAPLNPTKETYSNAHSTCFVATGDRRNTRALDTLLAIEVHVTSIRYAREEGSTYDNTDFIFL